LSASLERWGWEGEESRDNVLTEVEKRERGDSDGRCVSGGGAFRELMKIEMGDLIVWLSRREMM